MMPLIEQDISRQQIRIAGQVFAVRQYLKACCFQSRSQVAGITICRDILQRLDTQPVSSCLDIGSHAAGAICLALDGDLRRIVIGCFQMLPISTALILVIAYQIVLRCLTRKVCQHIPYISVRVPKYAVPWTVIPCTDFPLSPCLIARCATRIFSVFVMSTITDHCSFPPLLFQYPDLRLYLPLPAP